MKKTSSYHDMAFSSLNVFADDGTVNLSELTKLIELAMKDGVIDFAEKNLLKNIFKQVLAKDISDDLRHNIKILQLKHDL